MNNEQIRTGTDYQVRSHGILSDLVTNDEKMAECGMIEQAAEVATLVLSFDADNAAALNILGYNAAMQGDCDRAIDCFQRSRQADPNCLDAAVNLFAVYKQAGRHDDAASLRKTLLESRPDDKELVDQLAERSIDEIRAMIDHDPENAAYHLEAASLYERQGDQAKALEYYENAWELDPSNASVGNKANELRSRIDTEAA